MLAQDNILRTQEIAENSWDTLHPDIARLLLNGIISFNGRFIYRRGERVFVKALFAPGTLIPETSGVQPIYTFGDIQIFRLSDLGGNSIGQKVNGNIVRCPRTVYKQIGALQGHGENYPNIICSVESDDTSGTDVHNQVHQVFPLGVIHQHQDKEAKHEEVSSRVREHNRTLVEQIIANG